MSILNKLLNRGLLGTKCKTSLSLAISRIKLLQNRRDAQLQFMRKEIAQFLQSGEEAMAQIRVEHVIREQNIWAAYEILELFCEFVLARVPIVETQRDCPSELCEAVASIIFAAPRCADLPDLLHARNLFESKYGKEFTSAASELRPGTSVNRTIIEKLSVSAPSAEVKLKALKDIAQEYNVEWDSSKTEAEFSRKPEDLLVLVISCLFFPFFVWNGPKQVCSGSGLLTAPFEQRLHKHSPSNEAHPTISTEKREEVIERRQPRRPSNVNSSTKNENATRDSDLKVETASQSSDVLERAQVAIAAAERATAAAHAAARLVNVEFSAHRLEPNN